jgi:hypothetical protein
MPLLPPVMNATFPSSFFMVFTLALISFKFARVVEIEILITIKINDVCALFVNYA